MFRKIVLFLMIFLITSVSIVLASPLQSGIVWSTGSNVAPGELGLYDNVTRTSFTQTDLANVSAVAGGGGFSLALGCDGTVWATGHNCEGELGIGVWDIKNHFYHGVTDINGTNITDVVRIAAGQYHSMALKNDGTVWVTGANPHGQLGLGNATPPVPIGFGVGDIPSNKNVFNKVPSLTNVVAMDGGWNHSLVLKSDGTVWATGDNACGDLGLGDTDVERNTYTKVPGLTNVVGIAAGAFYSLALKSDGTVWAAGCNYYHALGLGPNVGGSGQPVTSFTQVPGLSGVVAIATGYYHSLALKSDGTVWTAGYNGDGQLGLGDNTNRDTFTKVTNLTTNVVSIASGGFVSFVKKSDGTLWAVGDNVDGQLGLGDSIDRNTFTQVPGLTDVAAFAGGYHHSLAVSQQACTPPPPTPTPTPVGYNPQWLMITLVSLMGAGGFLLRRRATR